MDGNSLIGEIRGYRKKRFERQVRKVGGEREKAVNLNKNIRWLRDQSAGAGQPLASEGTN